MSMDANAKSTLWFSPKADSRGIKVLEFMSEHRLFVRNDSPKPTFSSEIGSSHIDLTLTTEATHKMIMNWDVLDTDSLSDHNYICYSINTEVGKNHNVIEEKKFCTKKADWDYFNKKLEEFYDYIRPLL
jgi:hypothetical protein